MVEVHSAPEELGGEGEEGVHLGLGDEGTAIRPQVDGHKRLARLAGRAQYLADNLRLHALAFQSRDSCLDGSA